MIKKNLNTTPIIVWLILLILVGCNKEQEPTISFRVKQIIATQLNKDPNSIELGDSLMGNSLGADELDVVEIIISLEEEFQIEIPDDLFMDKNIQNSVGIPESLNTQKLIDIVNIVLKQNR